MKEAIKNFIIDKAADIFAARGYHETTLEEIAAAANVSKPTLYNYFKNKEDLFCSVVENFHLKLDAEVGPALNASNPFPQKLHNLVNRLLFYVNEHRSILKIAVYEARVLIESMINEKNSILEKFLEIRNLRIKKLVQLAEEGKNEGFVNKQFSSEHIALFIMGILDEFNLSFLLGQERLDSQQLKNLSELIYRMMSKGIFKE